MHYMYNFSLYRWFGQRLDFLSSMFVTLVFFSSISLADGETIMIMINNYYVIYIIFYSSQTEPCPGGPSTNLCSITQWNVPVLY